MTRWTTIIAWGDRHGFATSLLARVVAPIMLGAALGVGLVWLVETLPRPLGAALVVVVAVAIFAWCVRELRWTRRMLEEIRRTWEPPEEEQ